MWSSVAQTPYRTKKIMKQKEAENKKHGEQLKMMKKTEDFGRSLHRILRNLD